MFDSIENIYFIFQGLNKSEKIDYLQNLKNQNLSYKINWDNLIKLWQKN